MDSEIIRLLIIPCVTPGEYIVPKLGNEEQHLVSNQTSTVCVLFMSVQRRGDRIRGIVSSNTENGVWQ